jgi:hypothetical protein
LKTVGVVTVIDEGIVKNTRRADPEIVVTEVAVAVALGGPATAGCNVIVTFDGGMVPLGKFAPITSMFVIPD